MHPENAADDPVPPHPNLLWFRPPRGNLDSAAHFCGFDRKPAPYSADRSHPC